MKKILFLILLLPAFAFSQIKATTEAGDAVLLSKDGTWKYVKQGTVKGATEPALSKRIIDTSYSLSGIVLVKNAKDEKVEVQFDAMVPRELWDYLVKKWPDGESSYFSLVANMLSIEAQYSLKSTLSFEPFPKQFFIFSNGAFKSAYKMYGRNGYGNLGETSALVSYNPFKDIKE